MSELDNPNMEVEIAHVLVLFLGSQNDSLSGALKAGSCFLLKLEPRDKLLSSNLGAVGGI